MHRGWVWLASILAPLLMGPAHGRNIPVFVDGANEIVVVKRPAIAGSINVVSGTLPKGAAVTIGSSKRLIRGDRRFAYTAPGSGTYRVTPTTPSASCSFSPSYVDVTLGPDATVAFSATCGPAPIDSAAFVSQSVSEVLTAGGTYTVTVTVQNNGTSTWSPGQYFLALTNVAWSPRIVNLTSSVGPGQTVTFTFDLTVPQQTGDYSVRWQMSTPDATFGPMTADMSISVVPPVQLSYIHTDALGTPRLITSATTNNVLWRWDNLEPFGNNSPDENPSGLGAFTYNYRFPGQYFDAETGTHYNYFRDYDPTLGRYVESDPIGLYGGASTYAYVDSDPLGFGDPLGLCRVELQFKPIPIFSFRKFYHAFIVTDDHERTRTFFRGGPTGSPNLGSAFGDIGTDKGDYIWGTKDFVAHPIKIVVLDNDEPCDCYNSSFSNTLDKIKNNHFSYNPLTRNSNSVAGTALRAAGFNVGPLPVSAPGFDTTLGPK